MKAFAKSRPSPALIVAVIALSMALVGTAVAGTDGLSRAITKSKVKQVAKKQANKAIDRRAPGLAVARADTAGSADNVLATEVPNGCATASGGTGGISAAAAGNECNVTFPQAITDCAIVLGTVLDFPGGGETTYRKLSASVVQVSRRDSAGGSDTAGAFSIAAICPA